MVLGYFGIVMLTLSMTPQNNAYMYKKLHEKTVIARKDLDP